MLSTILNNAFITLEDKKYLSLFILIIATLNFLAGINIYMYSPSMPAIATHFNVSNMAVKNTITISIIGWSIGCIVFGILIDSLGRKTIVSFGLFSYLIASFVAVSSESFIQLMIIRFIQGLMVATVTVGCRAFIIDRVRGKRYSIAILYASLAYSCGAVFGPFIGGFLQSHFGWKANFIAFGIIASILLSLLLSINESLSKKQSLHLTHIFLNSANILKHKSFIAGVLLFTISNIELMLYPTIGPFIVEDVMHYTAIIYGYTALIVSLGYLSGAILCRYLLHRLPMNEIYKLAFSVLIIAVIIAYVFTLLFSFNLWTLLLPMVLLNITVGLITPNVTGTNLKLFATNAGLAMAVQVGLCNLLTAIGLFLVSHVSVNNLLHLAMLYSVLVIMQCILFFKFYFKNFMDPWSKVSTEII